MPLVQVVVNEVFFTILVCVDGTEPKSTFAAVLTLHCLLTVAETSNAKEPADVVPQFEMGSSRSILAVIDAVIVEYISL